MRSLAAALVFTVGGGLVVAIGAAVVGPTPSTLAAANAGADEHEHELYRRKHPVCGPFLDQLDKKNADHLRKVEDLRLLKYNSSAVFNREKSCDLDSRS